ncbi:unnamed protein product, partial [Closterium sp. NIES-54]
CAHGLHEIMHTAPPTKRIHLTTTSNTTAATSGWIPAVAVRAPTTAISINNAAAIAAAEAAVCDTAATASCRCSKPPNHPPPTHSSPPIPTPINLLSRLISTCHTLPTTLPFHSSLLLHPLFLPAFPSFLSHFLLLPLPGHHSSSHSSGSGSGSSICLKIHICWKLLLCKSPFSSFSLLCLFSPFPTSPPSPPSPLSSSSSLQGPK